MLKDDVEAIRKHVSEKGPHWWSEDADGSCEKWVSTFWTAVTKDIEALMENFSWTRFKGWLKWVRSKNRSFLADFPDSRRITQKHLLSIRPQLKWKLELIEHERDASVGFCDLPRPFACPTSHLFSNLLHNFAVHLAFPVIRPSLEVFLLSRFRLQQKFAWINQDDNLNWIKLIYELCEVGAIVSKIFSLNAQFCFVSVGLKVAISSCFESAEGEIWITSSTGFHSSAPLYSKAS